jgi:8-amino-7-oxononanoate synthase
MDGDFAPLLELVAIAKARKAWLMVDDAHGLGVLGQQGGGVLEYYALNQNDVPVLVGTLGKSFGTFGAFVAGSEELIETLIQKARTYIYTTALPAAVAEATRASLKRVIADTWRRDKLNHLIERFKSGAKQLHLPMLPSTSAIQPMMIHDTKQAVMVSDFLYEQGFLVSAIRPPTVPQNGARLRVTLSALHEDQHIDSLLDAFDKIHKKKE